MTDNLTIATYNRIARRWTERNIDRAPQDERYAAFASAVAGHAPTGRFRILDAGCGPGLDSRWFHERGFRVVGADLSAGMLAEARRRAPGVDFVQGDLRRLGFSAASFDGIWCNASLLHLPRVDVPGVLASFRRFVDHGFLYLSVKLGEGDEVEEAAYGAGNPRFFTYFSRPEIELYLERAGFEVQRTWDATVTPERTHPFVAFLAQTQLETPLLGANAVIFDSTGRVLLSERADGRGWNLPAGFVSANEAPEEAIIRELREETGLEVQVDRLLGVYSRNRRYRGHERGLVTTTFLCRVIGGTLTPTKEALRHGWFDPVVLPVPMASAHHVAILRDAIAVRAGALAPPVLRRLTESDRPDTSTGRGNR